MQRCIRTFGDSHLTVSQHLGSDAAWSASATSRMNRMYRWQRYIYDGTRRYYLLGRDRLLANLEPPAGGTVLEIGCGTGRNLIQAARRYPAARLFGIDVSTEMLTTATSAVGRCGLTDRIRLAHGDATAFDARALFGVAAFDRIFISYSLSMIPDWPRVLDAAIAQLADGGSLHIVDFGGQELLPRGFRTLLFRWLTLFDVTPRSELESTLKRLADRGGADLRVERPLRGYAQLAMLTRPHG
jgi:S-adenosylmethionine-diacylgycerolhomoserine-N-methlytransferase